MAASLWNLRPYAYRALDRRPTRIALARAATWAARRETDRDVELFHDGAIWMYRSGDAYLPGEPRFVYRHGAEIAGWPGYERDATEDFWFHLYRPAAGDVIVDVGAGIGAETQVFSRAVGDRGRVVSIEANPSTYRRLVARTRWNRLDNVTPVNRAIVDRDRTVVIEDRDVHERNAVHLEAGDGVPVAGTSLDDLLRDLDIERIDFLKMNIEGAERLAIEGMTESIRHTSVVCIACHGGTDSTREPVIAFLEDAGFEVSTRDDDPRGYVRDHVHGVRR